MKLCGMSLGLGLAVVAAAVAAAQSPQVDPVLGVWIEAPPRALLIDDDDGTHIRIEAVVIASCIGVELMLVETHPDGETELALGDRARAVAIDGDRPDFCAAALETHELAIELRFDDATAPPAQVAFVFAGVRTAIDVEPALGSVAPAPAQDGGAPIQDDDASPD